ncbi:MAG: Ig-like domain-containing protein, partial [Candidatus Glassbacteria bacterium]|nr:Ig-like domain-containing protein [Candidatus Glassbacteria bacterium]
MSLRSLAVISALWLPVLGLSCARMGPPPGGPVDTERPRVAVVVPAPDSTGVGTDAEIEIVFSEKVNKQDAERLVKLSPPAGRLYFRWKGARVRVRPEPGLRQEMTYRLRVEPGLTDLHRVKNDSAFTSYFATGLHFSPGRIEGTVSCRDTLVADALLYAAAVEDTTLVFETASDSAGRYFFAYLPYGQYRLSAFRDRNRNGRYDYTREEGADSLADLIFDPLKINFRLELGDTTAPFPGSVSTPDSLTVELVFDDMLDSLRGISGAAFELRTPDSLGREMAV